MQIIDGRPVYAATDLVGFLECEHLLALERAALAGLVERPERVDPELDVLRERGEEHEQRFLDHLQEERGIVAAVGRGEHDGTLGAGDELRRDVALTLRHMRAGEEVIFQATFFDGTWRGYADFLLRVDGADAGSELGAWHYEIADTKLARRTKGGALLQMCVYSDLLAAVQGRMPERMHVALGGSGHRVDSHRLDDYLAYYRRVKERFLLAAGNGASPAYPLASTPVPVRHCEVCRWQADCAARRRADDHLSLVAGMRSDQASRLVEAGIGTTTALGTLGEPLPSVDGVSDAALRSLQAQARLQVLSRGAEAPKYEPILPIEPNRGLAALPAPDAGDLFFDMEGDPFAEEDGLEYLFGVIDPLGHDDERFRTWWAHTRDEEKAAFESFVDFVMDRWRRHPAMHVYHYAAYERSRLGMLSTRHGTREDEVDRLLRGDVLVDLYRVVRQGMRIGTESYSIKKLEPLYALERSIELKDAGLSVVAYERYIKSVAAGRPEQAILDEIAAYNRDDCESTLSLRDWLEARRTELERTLDAPIPRLGPRPEELEREPNARDQQIADVASRLLAGLPADAAGLAGDERARWLLAMLMEWHRREEKVEWWEFFRRSGLTDAELANDEQALGELSYVGVIGEVKQSLVHRYRYDPAQEHRVRVGDIPVDPRTGAGAGRVWAMDPLAGTIDLLRGRKAEAPHPTALIPARPLTAGPQKGAMLRIGTWVAEREIGADGPYRAVRDLLRGMAPRAGQRPGGPLTDEHEPPLDAARRVARSLDRSHLPVQGPPGSGKTYTGAEMILALLDEGRRVGITAFTHKAIANLLDEVLVHAALQGRSVRAIRKVDDGEDPEELGYPSTRTNEDVAEALRSGEVQIAAGTPWLWARGELEGLVDTIVVDEAGQMSLANVVAIGGAASNVILLGDPQQLSQVKKGAHPPGADASALEHILGDHPTVPDHLGLFLRETWRMHPDLTAFTSPAFYEGRLVSRPETRRQTVQAPPPYGGTGVRWLPVEHAGNRNESAEEAAVVAEAYRALHGAGWRDWSGTLRPLDADEILVVAPYNAQVERLAQELPGARVGTVDKFQGQQGAVVVYSMATSSQDELPRTMEFLYSLNRLNVATSRARCLVVVVASPRLLAVHCHTPQQMRLANALCRFVELADEQAARVETQTSSSGVVSPASSVSAAELMQ